ncbi:hypothetical protein WICMUC_003063 [Wickerhamomyces mucosus]|uniref:Lactoylglutathione lyase n=1 Tax=Wickerhamomyces mucosus TaxID=1378264 RepID=A0A9P8PNP4_9ASCO|nr:hypothetical protein WICMUC_003063 [Wickerhamomyces mucosus]
MFSLLSSTRRFLIGTKSFQSIRTMASYNPKSIVFNHTCLRVKDPKVSVDYYTKNFGLKLIATKQFPELKFDLYFLSFNDAETGSPFDREGVLELTHNYGTENDPDYKINNGNVEPYRGFGHICFSVDNIQKSEENLLANGVKFQKKLSDGRQKNIAFALDPDNYWIELIEHGISKVENKTELSTYKFNHTMIRVKDPVASLKFYREVLGFKLLSTSVHENAKFTLYFLGYNHEDSFEENSLTRNDQASLESVLELTWNWGTEKEEGQIYHNGNVQVEGAEGNTQGYGHIGISVDNAEAWTKELEEKWGDQVTWGLKFNQGKLKNIAFIRDPDNYAIEILPSVGV